MDRRKFLQAGIALGAVTTGGASASLASPGSILKDRDYWVQSMLKIADPVQRALSDGKLRVRMPVEAPHGNLEDRKRFTYLEAMGRLLAGMAPWLESNDGSEGMLRAQYAELSRSAIRSATDPDSPDFMNFNKGSQPVVDTAFLSLAIVRAPTELWHKLDRKTQLNVIAAVQSSRVIRPGYSNWLLFAAMNEAALSLMGVWWDPMRIDYALRTMDTWYKGDGVYGDGPQFHFDYYNSFVIHPFLLNVLEVIGRSSNTWNSLKERTESRARRYAAIQERLISPDATFPPTGRSLAYRFPARFICLPRWRCGEASPTRSHLRKVRCALTAVMRKECSRAPGVFESERMAQDRISMGTSLRLQNPIYQPAVHTCARRFSSLWDSPPLIRSGAIHPGSGPQRVFGQERQSGPDHALTEDLTVGPGEMAN